MRGFSVALMLTDLLHQIVGRTLPFRLSALAPPEDVSRSKLLGQMVPGGDGGGVEFLDGSTIVLIAFSVFRFSATKWAVPR